MKLRRGSFLPERAMARLNGVRPRRGAPDPGLVEMQERLRYAGTNLGANIGLGFTTDARTTPSGSPAADAMRSDLGFQ